MDKITDTWTCTLHPLTGGNAPDSDPSGAVCCAAYRATLGTATLATISEAHAATVGAWTGADWTHELVLGGERQTDGDGDAVYCEGDTTGCEACEKARIAARSATDAASHVVSYWTQGEPLLALIAAGSAADMEAEFGDDPVYRPLVAAVEAAIHTLADSSQAWAEKHAEAVASV